MATSDQIKNALLTEHFRYTPLVRAPFQFMLALNTDNQQTLLDDIINTVNELVYQAVSEIETALLNVPKEQLGFPANAPAQQDGAEDNNGEDASEAAARTEIEAGIVKLESLLNSTIDKNFDKLEIYTLRNLLTVSNAKEDEGLENWIVLDHYKVRLLF
jgi:kinetochore protein Mis12/MTW1